MRGSFSKMKPVNLDFQDLNRAEMMKRDGFTETLEDSNGPEKF